jgi:DNA replication and repair protein RecF
MLIRRLTVENLRSRTSLTVQVGERLTVLVGPNGSGKTTMLEAAVLALHGDPLRSCSIRDLIRQGASHLRVEVELDDNGSTVVAAAAYARDGEKRLTAGGVPLADFSRWREALPVRTFVPDDLRLIKGSPRRRRLYLDTLAARRDPVHLANLRDYEEALAQRNSLLRMTRITGDDEQFEPWEAMLADTGIAVCGQRASALADFIGPFQQMHQDLTGEPRDTFHLTYRTNVAGLDPEEYRRRLADSRSADRQRTYTHLGPHRDDFRLMRATLDMRDCASQGEQRAALLTLVLAEWEYLASTGPAPLLLLDDVMSELDEQRRRALLGIVAQGGQVLVTSTDLRYFSQDELDQAAVVELTPEASEERSEDVTA